MIFPWECTETEGGNFKIWKGGSVTYQQLKKLIGKQQVSINGVLLHCLIFESAGAGHSRYGRWDSINGWTTTIAQAKHRFPNGLHGLPNKYNIGEQSGTT
jgi:hypothetical protein